LYHQYLENVQLKKMSERKDRKLMELNKDLAQFKKRSKQLIRLEDNIIGLVDENKTLRNVRSNVGIGRNQKCNEQGSG
jgi:hypothetical protein